MRELKFRHYCENYKEMLYSCEDFFNLEHYFSNHPYSHSENMQFTGLQDKNGVDIYEGDIVYIAGYGALCVSGISDLVILIDALAENDIGGIIGNIHQNPELLTC